MLNLKIVGASLLLGASTAAVAQEEPVTTGIGTDVSALAQAQKEAEDKTLLGAQVSAMARAQRPENVGDDDDVDEEGDVASASQGIGADVSADAQLQRDRTVEERTAFGTSVVARTPAATRAQTGLSTAAEARAAGAAAAADARAAASANRADVTQIRATAGAARAEAQAAASTARNIRDTVRAARPGRGR